MPALALSAKNLSFLPRRLPDNALNELARSGEMFYAFPYLTVKASTAIRYCRSSGTCQQRSFSSQRGFRPEGNPDV